MQGRRSYLPRLRTIIFFSLGLSGTGKLSIYRVMMGIPILTLRPWWCFVDCILGGSTTAREDWRQLAWDDEPFGEVCVWEEGIGGAGKRVN